MALVVMTGGARSGKSAAAERLARLRALDGAAVTVAVFGRERDDAEFAERIAKHRAVRPHIWSTVEATSCGGWCDQIDEGSLLLVDCVGTLLGLAMEEAYQECAGADLREADPYALPQGYERAVTERFDAVLAWIAERLGDTIVVTNEVGAGTVPLYASARLFRDLLGRANRLLVQRADAAYLCVAGRLIDLAALPADATWPED